MEMGRDNALGNFLRRAAGAGAPHGEAPRKHLVLFVAMVVFLVGQPLLAHRSTRIAELTDLAFSLVYVYVLFIVFEARRQRRLAQALLVPVIVSKLVLYATPASTQTSAAVVFHCTVIAFLGYTVSNILRSLFGRKVISGDDVLGAVCGYILGGVAWGNVYALVYRLVPEAFSVSSVIAPQFDDLRLRQCLLDYFSFTTLTSIGYSDITPVGPPVYSLVWLEVMFGQFYMAVVVAQLVGLKLAQAISHSGPEPK